MAEETKTIDWESLNSKLPYERTDEAKEKRKELFKQFDPNGNGYLSLAEVDKGMRDVLHSEDLFDCKAAVQQAFHYAKKVSPSDDKHGPELIEFCEFRLFLQTLRQYFEYYQAFDRIDVEGDSRICKSEFCSDTTKTALGKWVKDPIEDMEATFDEIDENKGGQILFKEFVEWAVSKNLDIEDDVDDEELPPKEDA